MAKKKPKKIRVLTQKAIKTGVLWKRMREIVLRRDKHKCQICHSTYGLQIDHFVSRACNPLYFELKNLTTLCGRCHTKKSFGVQGWDIRLNMLVMDREGAKWVDWAIYKAKNTLKLVPEEVEVILDKYEKQYPNEIVGGR